MMRAIAVLLLGACVSAFNVQAPRGGIARPRCAQPAMQFFKGAGKQEAGVPRGWKKVPSESRPGQFSYLNLKTGQKYDRLPKSGAFYDDEQDTTYSKDANWDPFAFEKRASNFRSDVEAAGFNDDGEDLANTGGGIYVALLPFLALVIAYSTGLFSFGYEKGNF